MGGDSRRSNPAEIEALHPRADRLRDLVRLRGCQNEHDMLGWLFKRLEKGVPSWGGQHVGLVNDVDLDAQRRRKIVDLVAQITHLVDAPVAGRIDLENVDR